MQEMTVFLDSFTAREGRDYVDTTRTGGGSY